MIYDYYVGILRLETFYIVIMSVKVLHLLIFKMFSFLYLINFRDASITFIFSFLAPYSTIQTRP